MKISSFPSDINRSEKLQSFNGSSKVIYMPDVVGEIGKFVGEHISVAEKKLIQNTTATFIQPKIDMKFGDEDEKTDIAIKSVSKSLAGGLTGFIIRAACINLFKRKLTFDDTSTSIVRKFFMPDGALDLYKSGNTQEAIRSMKTYNETMGTIAAIVIMSAYTNKNIDVPLTRTFEKFIGGVVKSDKTWHRSAYDIYKNHKDKYDELINKYKNTYTTEKGRATKFVNGVKRELAEVKAEVNKDENSAH